MLSLSNNQKIYVYTDPVDMRKAINGLSIILAESFDKNPQEGDVYLFTNKRRDKIKCLFWHKNGFCLYYKRLEKGRFQYSEDIKENEILITEAQLKVLLFGFDFYLLGDESACNYQDFF